MKLILKKDVEKLGKEGDIVKVKSGYGRNFLVPQDLAILGTPKEIKSAELKNEALKEEKEKIVKELQKKAERIKKASIKIKSKVGESGKLFGSVTCEDIAKELKNQLGIEVDKKNVEIPEPIKKMGKHEVRVELGEGLKTKLRVEIEEGK